MDKYWKAFTRHGVKYLAIRRGNNIHIIDEDGNNYGSWMEIESFLNWKEEIGPVGKIRELSFQCL